MIDFGIPDELIKARIGGRWVHKASGRSYHTEFAPPKAAGLDDATGEPLMQRPDDKPETVGKRLAAFHEQTAPVLDFYRARGRLSSINADAPIGAVWADVRGIIARDAGAGGRPAATLQ